MYLWKESLSIDGQQFHHKNTCIKVSKYYAKSKVGFQSELSIVCARPCWFKLALYGFAQ